jgi:hypothetical protein
VSIAPSPPQVRLRAFEVESFRLFRTERLELEDDVTILVGLNDTGKSTLLSALAQYGLIIHGAGFRELLSGTRFPGTAAGPTIFGAEWVVDGQIWTHRLVFDPSRPAEFLASGDAFWSWNPKTRVLKTAEGTYEVKELDRLVSLASVSAEDWQLDSDVPEAVWRPLEVTQWFNAPQPYLFEPGTLSLMAPLDVEVTDRNGFGWALWLQEIINRRNDDLAELESVIRSIFPFFGRVLVREHRARVVRETVDTLPIGAAQRPRRKRRDVSPQSELERVAAGESRREVLFELPGLDQLILSGGHAAAVPAENVSSGLLLALAHFALVMTTPEGGIVALEEPENGLNARVMLDMMRAFLRMSRMRRQQLILASHNGWWLDLLPTRSFRVLTRDATGGHVHRPMGDKLKSFLDEQGMYASELFGTFGPEGLLQASVPK